jgi:uncharacterized membrane protein YccC
LARGDRTRKAAPVSIALAEPERSSFEAEAKRRRLGLSTTIRALAFERANEIREERQRERARRWQTERLHELMARIERDGFEEVTQAEIDAIFTAAGAQPRREQAAAGD